MLAQASDPSLPARAIAFLLFSGVIAVVVWGALCLFRRFRTWRAFAAVATCSAVLTGLLFAIPSRTRRGTPTPQVAVAEPPSPVSSNARPREPQKFWAPPTEQDRQDKLATDYVDEANGFAIRFPKGWTVRKIKGDPWIVEANDGTSAFMSIGVTPNPPGLEKVIARLDPAKIEQSILARPNATLHARGTDQLQGVPYLYYKYTSEMPMTDASPRMTMTHYLVPRAGHILEARIAATPETFKTFDPLFNVSMNTFRLVPDPRGTTVQSNAER